MRRLLQRIRRRSSTVVTVLTAMEETASAPEPVEEGHAEASQLGGRTAAQPLNTDWQRPGCWVLGAGSGEQGIGARRGLSRVGCGAGAGQRAIQQDETEVDVVQVAAQRLQARAPRAKVL